MSANKLRVRLGVIFAALAGLSVAVWLIAHIGFRAVIAAAARVGWDGFGLICLLGLAQYALLGSAWFALIPKAYAPKITTYIWGRATRDSAGEVLPFSQLGGFVIGARAVMLRGTGAPLALASTILDVTAELMAQVAFVLVGIAILVTHVPRSAPGGSLANTAMIAMLLAALGTLAFLAIQKRAFSYAERIAARILPRAAAHAAAAHDAMTALHASPLRLFFSASIHLLAWFASALAAFVALRLMGVHAAFASVVAIESLLCAIRSAAFAIPNALGVQEAAYAMLMPLFGLAAPAGLALSLLRRARDITVGIPILLIWQAWEGERALGKSDSSDLLLGDK